MNRLKRFRTEKYITREMVRAEPDTLFVFGDSFERRGFGGQAMEMRGEPNAVGIPTKRRPTMNEDAFFKEKHFDIVKPVITDRFWKLADHIRSGGCVVWPENGIGSGLAQLWKRAPSISKLIEDHRRRLIELAMSFEREISSGPPDESPQTNAINSEEIGR